MPRPRSRLLLAAGALALSAALAGCGGSSDQSLVHFQGSSASISKATLNHWMRATVGADALASIGPNAPQGLAAEPANGGECVEAAKKIVPRSPTGELTLTDAQIKHRCEVLHQALKEQALSTLISAQWTANEAAAAGIHIAPSTLHTEFERYRDQDMPSEAELHQYLTARHWEVSDILFELRTRLMTNGLKPQFDAEVKQAGDNDAAFAKITLEHYHSDVSKTSCKPGYVVPGCKQYREPPGGAPVPNIILEEFTRRHAASNSPSAK